MSAVGSLSTSFPLGRPRLRSYGGGGGWRQEPWEAASVLRAGGPADSPVQHPRTHSALLQGAEAVPRRPSGSQHGRGHGRADTSGLSCAHRGKTLPCPQPTAETGCPLLAVSSVSPGQEGWAGGRAVRRGSLVMMHGVGRGCGAGWGRVSCGGGGWGCGRGCEVMRVVSCGRDSGDDGWGTMGGALICGVAGLW